MRHHIGIALLALLLLTPGCNPSGKVDAYAANIAPLIEPSKLATLQDRAANPRVQKATFWLAAAQLDSTDAKAVATQAVRRAGYSPAAARMTADALIRNLTIAEQLGCLDSGGFSEMRQGRAPTVRRGPYAGDQLSVDHIIPVAISHELRSTIANLELMPQRMNSAKGAKTGQRQRDLAQKLYGAGLLSERGYHAVIAAR